MRWAICFFVRDRATQRIVHHEIDDIDTDQMLAPERTKIERQRFDNLAKEYPPGDFEVFRQGFDSRESLYSTWPELNESKRA